MTSSRCGGIGIALFLSMSSCKKGDAQETPPAAPATAAVGQVQPAAAENPAPVPQTPPPAGKPRCETFEDTKQAKDLIKRGIVRARTLAALGKPDEAARELDRAKATYEECDGSLRPGENWPSRYGALSI